MKKQTKVGIGIVVVLAVLAVIIAQPFAIISADRVEFDSATGLPRWVLAVAPSGTGEKVTFSRTVADIPKSPPDSKGGTYAAASGFSLTLDRKTTSCEYQLVDDTYKFDSIGSWVSSLWGSGYHYYRIRNPTRNMPILVTPSKGTPQTINGANPSMNYVFQDPDGKGTLTVTSLGFLSGLSSCPDTTDVAILQYQNGLVKFMSSSKATQCHNTILESYLSSIGFAVCFRDAEVDFPTRFPKGTFVQTAEGRFVGNLDDSGAGLSMLTVVADAEYLGYQYTPPSQGIPKIVSVAFPAKSVESKQNAFGVTVKNIGTSDGTFTLSSTQKGLTLGQPTYQIQLKAGEQNTIYGNYVAGAVNADTATTNTLNFCTTSQLGGNKCVTSDYTTLVQNEGIIPKPNACGDGKCVSPENAQTCAADCPLETKCEKPNEVLTNGVCVCTTDYVRDDANVCVKDNSDIINLLLIGLGLVAIIVVMFVIKSKMGGSKSSGSRKAGVFNL